MRAAWPEVAIDRCFGVPLVDPPLRRANSEREHRLRRAGAHNFLDTEAEPGPEVARYHNRQIAVLDRADWAAWLDPLISAKDLLKPLPAGGLAVEPGRLIGSSKMRSIAVTTCWEAGLRPFSTNARVE